MKALLQRTLRQLANAIARVGRYRYLRAHVWDDAMREMCCGDCT